MFRYLLFAFGVIFGLPLIVILLLLPNTPITFVGLLYLLGCIFLVSGMLGSPWWRRHSSMAIRIGSSIIFATIAIRTIFPPFGSQLNLVTLPNQSGPRWLNRILNERDVILFGAKIAPYIGAISSEEKKSLDFELSHTYNEMRSHGVTHLSPFLTTYLHQQRPNEFDVVISESRSETLPRTGIIFLHGYGGNFTLQCWLVAEAGNQIGVVTVCPSTDPDGRWWNAQGSAILQETITYLHQRGVERIYLAGLSNGGIGASRLAHRFKTDLVGLILISGADPDAGATGLPVLVVQGKYDERITTAMVERYITADGSDITYKLFEGDHFVLLKKADQVQGAITDWLSQQESH